MKALLMVGGQGTRFWPMSTEECPKQFLPLAGERTMLQETVARLQPSLEVSDIYLVASSRYAAEILRQLPEVEEKQVIIEPLPRNTAPCIALASHYLRTLFPDEVVAVLPADHIITDVKEYHRSLYIAEKLAREGWLVTFGIRPSYPAIGFGYIRRGKELSGRKYDLPAFRVERFTEKPDLELAKQFCGSGRYYWNSGMFVWSLESIWSELEAHMPGLAEGIQEIDRHAGDADRILEIFSGLEKTSIDYGVMERTSRAAVVSTDFGWNDVGSWKALREVKTTDEDGIVSNVQCENVGSRDCIVASSQDKLVALVGVKDIVLVDTPEAVLVCSVEETEKVKEVVQKLKEKGLTQFL